MRNIPAVLFLGLLGTLAITGCRKPQPSTDDLFNTSAKLEASLPYPVLSWTPLTTLVDRSQQHQSILFANDIAATAARANQAYPSGAMVGLVTWQQRADPHWFGARIPGRPVSVEFVEFSGSAARYRSFAGPLLTEQPAEATTPQRIAQITAIKPVRLP